VTPGARVAALAALALAGCPAHRVPVRPLPVPLEAAAHHDEPALAGVVHVVRRGETIWRIARAYGIDPADLMETNGISDPRAVETGAELFVPGATRVVEVPAAAGGDASPTSTATATATATAIATPTSPPTSTSTSSATPPPAAAPPSARPAASAPREDARLAWPLQGVLYGRYGVRAGRRHDGIDIAAPHGTPVLAAGAGTVIYAGEQAGYGALVILKHDGGLVTLYAHNSRVLVGEGERVKRGQPFARVGESGRTSGPHLHFEVRDGTRPKNPLLFLP
jgi:murein DD-endopeptidase MepM/ murein hydrolase activator NlpD